jgi:hypothetical protein
MIEGFLNIYLCEIENDAMKDDILHFSFWHFKPCCIAYKFSNLLLFKQS